MAMFIKFEETLLMGIPNIFEVYIPIRFNASKEMLFEITALTTYLEILEIGDVHRLYFILFLSFTNKPTFKSECA